MFDNNGVDDYVNDNDYVNNNNNNNDDHFRFSDVQISRFYIFKILGLR